MPKQKVIALKVHSEIVEIDCVQTKISLPEGCEGICFVFESKKMARKYWGKKVPLAMV